MAEMNYKTTLENAKAELVGLQQELANLRRNKETIEKRLTAVRQIIAGCSRILGEEFNEEDSLGLTDAIRQVFATATTAIAPIEVRKKSCRERLRH